MSEMKNGRYEEAGDIYWFKGGKLHREDGPALEWPDGTKFWFINGQNHRENGPAIEWANGDKRWYFNGNLHREDGPAIESSNGTRMWYFNGLCHREDGPAYEGTLGEMWFLDDVRYTEDEFKIQLAKNQLNEKLHVTLSPSPSIKKGKI